MIGRQYKNLLRYSDSAYIQTTIFQGKEIPELEPFPHEWVRKTSNKIPFERDDKYNPEGYYE
ncbi:hypothetical protein MIDIC_230146 [Alphaproteobacteria bacterium]